jgi:GPH family glycoside/pentoside/hexuronide:cation symporter
MSAARPVGEAPAAARQGAGSTPSLATYLSYGVGMTGNQILRDVPTAMLLFYMTNAVLIPAAYAGFAILLPKIWVIVADPLVGSLSDRTRSRWGARKPFLLVGSLASTATFILLFSVPPPSSPLLATLLIGCLYLLMATAYSVYSVPYLTLASELGDKPNERTTALAYKQFFCLIGVLAGLALAPWLVKSFGGGRSAYTQMSLVIGSILFVTTIATAILTPTRKAVTAVKPATGNLLAQVIGSFAHRPFRIVFMASTLQLFAFGVSQAGGLYYLTYVMRLPITILGLNVAMSVIGAAASQPVWVKLSARFGTIPTYMGASLFSAGATGALLFVPPGAVWLFLVVGLVGGAATCGFTLMSFAALVEAIALDGPQSNRRGLFAAVYSAMEKAMLAVGGFVLAAALAASHFVQGAPLASQPAGVSSGIVMIFVWLPAALKLLSVAVLSRFTQRAPRLAGLEPSVP